jgi:hypothetical protein
MTIPDKQLLRHLAIAVLIKLAVLTVLWWVFIRDAGVSVDAAAIGARLGATISTQGAGK